MKNSYPDSLITLAAAFTQACSLLIIRNENPVAQVKTGVSTIHKSAIKNYKNDTTVGIKFDTMSARKYFVLIHTTQQKSVVNKAMEKYDNLVLPLPAVSGEKANSESHVTPGENELVRINECNEPSVKHQSTFL